MARTSKKKLKLNGENENTLCSSAQASRPELSVSRKYKTAVYVRLSVEDMRKKTDDSIGTQKAGLVEFVSKKADLELFGVYEDTNRSGTNFKRLGFVKMMEDIQKGNVDCVVVKDLSRFGRNFRETGRYLERIFPLLEVRFISVNDSFDSLTAVPDEYGLLIPLKNLINEAYARDCSRKTQSGFRVKQERGEFCGAFAPYGYIKDGTKLIVDKTAAAVVKMMFERRLEGQSISVICNGLNDLGIVPPGKYRFEKGITKAKKRGEASRWHPSAVKRILQNPVYTGMLAGAKYKSSFLNGGGAVKTNRDEWVIVENAHDPVVDKGIYLAVQETFGR